MVYMQAWIESDRYLSLRDALHQALGRAAEARDLDEWDAATGEAARLWDELEQLVAAAPE